MPSTRPDLGQKLSRRVVPAIWRSLRTHVAVCLLVGFSLYHSVAALRVSAANYVNRSGGDDITRFEMRFAPLRRSLSTNEYKTIGYLTDMPEDSHWLAGYFQTQYTLAPVIIGGSAEFPLVVPNLHNSSSINDLLRDRHLSPVADYGNGVLLLSRRTQ
jgi:hypothetical protein